jgi:ElaB/YqjD/DUF883 family membrane-anchored ribosome-binding protein
MTSETGPSIEGTGANMSDENAGAENHTSQNPVRQKIGTALAVARDKSNEIIADTREKSFRAANETNRLFQEHPIAAVAAAAAAGAVIAIFMPKLVIASKAGAAATKVGQVAKNATQNKVTRNAAQLVMSALAAGEGSNVSRAVGKAAQAVTDRVRARCSKTDGAD